MSFKWVKWVLLCCLTQLNTKQETCVTFHTHPCSTDHFTFRNKCELSLLYCIQYFVSYHIIRSQISRLVYNPLLCSHSILSTTSHLSQPHFLIYLLSPCASPTKITLFEKNVIWLCYITQYEIDDMCAKVRLYLSIYIYS